MRKDVVATRTVQPEPTEDWTDTTAPEVRRLVEAAESSQGRDSIGHQAVASLLSRGFPDALLVPPDALEAFRDANARRLLWIPFWIHFGPVALVVFLAIVTVVVQRGGHRDFTGSLVLSDGDFSSSFRVADALASAFLGAAWIAVGSLAAFAAPGSRRRRSAAILLVLGSIGVGAFFAPEVVLAFKAIREVPHAIFAAFGAAWLLAPVVLAYGSLRDHR